MDLTNYSSKTFPRYQSMEKPAFARFYCLFKCVEGEGFANVYAKN